MLTFVEYTSGTYSSLLLDNDSKNMIASLNIQNPVDINKLHCTIMYSRKPAPDAYSLLPYLPIKAKAKGFDVFGDCLVLLLESIDLYELHNATRELGATYDYDEYKPHITLSENNIEQNVSLLQIPDQHIIFNEYKTEPLIDD